MTKVPDLEYDNMLGEFIQTYSITNNFQTIVCRQCERLQNINNSKKKFEHDLTNACTNTITDYPWLHYYSLLSLAFYTNGKLIGFENLYHEFVVAEHTFRVALCKEFGNNASVFRYFHNKHTLWLKRLRLIRVSTYEALSQYLNANRR